MFFFKPAVEKALFDKTGDAALSHALRFIERCFNDYGSIGFADDGCFLPTVKDAFVSIHIESKKAIRFEMIGCPAKDFC